MQKITCLVLAFSTAAASAQPCKSTLAENLETGEQFAKHNLDQPIAPASTVKMALAVLVADAVQNKKLRWDQMIPVEMPTDKTVSDHPEICDRYQGKTVTRKARLDQVTTASLINSHYFSTYALIQALENTAGKAATDLFKERFQLPNTRIYELIGTSNISKCVKESPEIANTTTAKDALEIVREFYKDSELKDMLAKPFVFVQGLARRFNTTNVFLRGKDKKASAPILKTGFAGPDRSAIGYKKKVLFAAFGCPTSTDRWRIIERISIPETVMFTPK
jgi:D-alanyl-D-alanine carboxypeptidase